MVNEMKRNFVYSQLEYLFDSTPADRKCSTIGTVKDLGMLLYYYSIKWMP